MTMESRLEKLYEMGYRIESKEQPIENRMEEVMLKKRVTSSSLVKMTGVSKQTMHAIMNGKMKPGVDFALKVSTVLQVPVEELFSLNDSAWETLINDDGNSIYWDLSALELVERHDIKKLEDEKGVEYWDVEQESLITDETYQQILETAMTERMDEEMEKARQEKVRRRDEKVFHRMARESIEKDIETRYPKRFQRVVKRIKPQRIT